MFAYSLTQDRGAKQVQQHAALRLRQDSKAVLRRYYVIDNGTLAPRQHDK